MFFFFVAFFFFCLIGARFLASRAASASRRSTASRANAEPKGTGVLFLASAFAGAAIGTVVVAPNAAFAQRPTTASNVGANVAGRSELAAGGAAQTAPRRFDPLRRDALGVQTRYPAVAKIVGRDKAQIREDGSQTIPLYYGSGTFVAEVGEWGIVVSNWHVVSEARESIVAKFPTFSSPARVILRDETWDLAALVVRKPPRVAPIPISQAVPAVGDALWVAGYGESAGLTEFQIQGGRVQNYALLVADDEDETSGGEENASERGAGKLTNGVASAALAKSAASAPENALLYETLAVDKGVRKGDSGGPIFNRYGELAGVLWGSNGESTMGTYCIRVQYFLTQAIERLTALEAERATDAPTSDLLSWRPEEGVADAEGSELWARVALETSGVYPISQQPTYVAADGRETPETLRRVGREAALKRVRNALFAAENATATALPPSPPVFSPTFVIQQDLQRRVRPEIAEPDFWAKAIEAKREVLLARRTQEAAKVRETSVVDASDASENVSLAFAAENAINADFIDEPPAFASLGRSKGLGGPLKSEAASTSREKNDDSSGELAVALLKPVALEGDAARSKSADWKNDEETNDVEKKEKSEDDAESADSTGTNVEEKTNDSGDKSEVEKSANSKDEAELKNKEKRVKFNGVYLNDIQVYLIICAIFCLFYNAARLMTDADLKKERQKRAKEEGRARDFEGRDN